MNNKEIEKKTLEIYESADTEEVESDLDETETDTEDNDSEAELSVEERLAKLEATNKKLFARAKKAEGFKFIEGSWVKDEKSSVVEKPKTKITKQPKVDEVTLDDVRLINAGYDDATISKIKSLAKVLDLTVQEAMQDEMFLAWKKEQDGVKKKKDASLSSSKGSGYLAPKKNPAKMTTEEHKEYVKQIFG